MVVMFTAIKPGDITGDWFLMEYFYQRGMDSNNLALCYEYTPVMPGRTTGEWLLVKRLDQRLRRINTNYAEFVDNFTSVVPGDISGEWLLVESKNQSFFMLTVNVQAPGKIESYSTDSVSRFTL